MLLVVDSSYFRAWRASKSREEYIKDTGMHQFLKHMFTKEEEKDEETKDGEAVRKRSFIEIYTAKVEANKDVVLDALTYSGIASYNGR